MGLVIKRKTLCETVRLVLCLGLTLSSVEALARTELSASSKAVIEQARLLSTEGGEEAARRELTKFSHEQLLSGLRDGLKAGAPWSEAAAGAASSMNLTDLVPDLRIAFKAEGGWAIAYALGELTPTKDRPVVSEELSKTIGKFSAASAVAVIETLSRWKLGLRDASFESGLSNPSYEIRQSAVRNFLATRESLDVATQVARFQQSFAVKPYEVRLEALTAFAGLSSVEQAKLKSAVGDNLKAQCKSELETPVKAACGRVIASVAAKPPATPPATPPAKAKSK